VKSPLKEPSFLGFETMHGLLMPYLWLWFCHWDPFFMSYAII